MLNITSLHASVEKSPILRGINLTINPGEIHAILGPNGAGKSTLGQVILGNPKYTVTEGNITFHGEIFNNLKPHERAQKGFFLSFQSPPELDGVSAKELLLSAKKSIDPAFHSTFRFKKQLKKHLESLNLSDSFLDRELNTGASGGEKKKMEMASLLTLNPTVAFLDEIDSGVDVDTLHAIAENTKKFLQDTAKSLIIVSHTEKLLSLIPPTHVHILIDGQIVQSGGTKLITDVHKKGFKALGNK